MYEHATQLATAFILWLLIVQNIDYRQHTKLCYSFEDFLWQYIAVFLKKEALFYFISYKIVLTDMTLYFWCFNISFRIQRWFAS